MDDITVLYKGQDVPIKHFRVFMFNKKNESKLVESWHEFKKLIDSGEWFDDPVETKTLKQLPKKEG